MTSERKIAANRNNAKKSGIAQFRDPAIIKEIEEWRGER
jgi:hypothetical protein